MIIIAIIATITAYIIKGMCGFANTLVFSSIMSFTANNINITPTELLLDIHQIYLLLINNENVFQKEYGFHYHFWL